MSEQREGYATKSNELEKALRENELLRGAMKAQDERESIAGAVCDVPRSEYGCDWPHEMADRLIAMRNENADLKRLLDNALVGAKGDDA